MSSARTNALRLLRSVGLEEQARRVRRLFGSRVVQQDLRDDETATVVMAAVLREHDSAIDVGANRGGFLEKILRFAPHGRHIAYEPTPALARALRERFPSVDVRESAVADTDGDTTFYVHAHSWGSSLFPLGESATGEISVRTVRLDDDLQEVVPRFIKIDVEGAEGLVFRGAQRTLAEHRPMILFEHGTKSRAADIPSRTVWELLAPHGYRVFDLAGREYDLPSFESATVWNFLALP